MLNSVPVPLQALLWPLLGAASILLTRRFLPNWLRRLVALAAAVACLSTLWSMWTAGVERIDLFWEPLNLFRMSPNLYSDDLALLVGIILAWLTAATALGIRGSQPQSTAWHGLILVTLAGCLAMTMATNLLTLALASALLDLSLLAMAVFAPADADRVAWRMAVPGIVSTLLIVLGALLMDARVGTASFLAREIPVEMLVLLGMAGVLRLLVFPLHPRGLHAPENATTLLLSIGVGIYLLARVQTIDPILADLRWMPVLVGVGLVAGGLIAWAGGSRSTTRPNALTQLDPPAPPASTAVGSGGERPRPTEGDEQNKNSPQPALGRAWPGAAIQQASYAFALVILASSSVLWPLIGLTLALGTLAIWWDGTRERTSPHVSQQSGATNRFPALARWRESRLFRYGTALLPVLALASLAGVPFTVGAAGRWPFYGTLLGRGQPILLIGVLLADSFLLAGLVAALLSDLNRTGGRRPSPVAFVAMLALVVPLVVLGIMPSVLGLEFVALPEVSVWGLGFVYVLPWLFGIWLARVGIRLADYWGPVYRIVNLDWLYRALAWLGQLLAGAVHWIGQVGEGEGWFGWVLVILALGIMLLIIR